MKAHRIPCPEDKAEGDIRTAAGAFPYNTELVSANGCAFHVWLGARELEADEMDTLMRLARNTRDVVRFTFSDGAPTGYWPRHPVAIPEPH